LIISNGPDDEIGVWAISALPEPPPHANGTEDAAEGNVVHGLSVAARASPSLAPPRPARGRLLEVGARPRVGTIPAPLL
jgi:hypothetical protein